LGGSTERVKTPMTEGGEPGKSTNATMLKVTGKRGPARAQGEAENRRDVQKGKAAENEGYVNTVHRIVCNKAKPAN